MYETLYLPSLISRMEAAHGESFHRTRTESPTDRERAVELLLDPTRNAKLDLLTALRATIISKWPKKISDVLNSMTSIDEEQESDTRVCMSIGEDEQLASTVSRDFENEIKTGESDETASSSRPDGSFTAKQDNRRPRNPPRSRRVPNLLSGPALIPGPMTPNMGPFHPPFGSGNWNQPAPLAIFPNFMLAPSVEEEADEKRAAFVREAMQRAVGLPPILVETSTYGQQSESRRPVKKMAKPKRVPSKSPPRFDSADFPSLAAEAAVSVTTPPVSKLKSSRFPSKNQLKRITLFS